MGRTFVTGDTHGGAEGGMLKLRSKAWPVGKTLTRGDYLIVAGDFGGVWFEPGTHHWNKRDLPFQKFLTEVKPWTTLFVDGNHENHDLLAKLELVDMFGGKVGKVRDHLYHLRRGEIYTINGKNIFVFGGAESYDKENRNVGLSWWKEEVPSYAEMDYALGNLEKYNWEVDFVITHNCPEYVAAMFISQNSKNRNYTFKFTDPTTTFLEYIRGKLKFKEWYFGHWHHNWSWENFHMLYSGIAEIK